MKNYSLRNLIKSDIVAYYYPMNECIGIITFIKAFLDVDYRVTFYYRLANFLVKGRFKFLGILIYYRCKSRYGVDISPWAIIGRGLRLVHATDVVIGPKAIVGDYCRIFNGVTLGNARPDIADNKMPKIGDYCVLGTGAKIIGEIVVCDKIILGANSVIKNSIEFGSEYMENLKSQRMIGFVESGYVERLSGLSEY